jgi:hypothetical protein
MLHQILTESNASVPDRITAARHAGEIVVMNDGIADALLGIVSEPGQPEELRAVAAIAMGPVLEDADTFEFDDPDEVPITEQTFQRIQLVFRTIFPDDSVPKYVRRRVLEASVRAPQDWHRDAIAGAWSSGDRDWMLTAVFSMQYVRGFDESILDALKSTDTDIQYEAIRAAGNWEVDAAWPQIAALAGSSAAPKSLRIAAIEAVGSIRRQEGKEILEDLTHSRDQEIAEAAEEAMSWLIPAGDWNEFDDDDEDEEDTGDWLN